MSIIVMGGQVVNPTAQGVARLGLVGVGADTGTRGEAAGAGENCHHEELVEPMCISTSRSRTH